MITGRSGHERLVHPREQLSGRVSIRRVGLHARLQRRLRRCCGQQFAFGISHAECQLTHGQHAPIVKIATDIVGLFGPASNFVVVDQRH